MENILESCSKSKIYFLFQISSAATSYHNPAWRLSESLNTQLSSEPGGGTFWLFSVILSFCSWFKFFLRGRGFPGFFRDGKNLGRITWLLFSKVFCLLGWKEGWICLFPRKFDCWFVWRGGRFIQGRLLGFTLGGGGGLLNTIGFPNSLIGAVCTPLFIGAWCLIMTTPGCCCFGFWCARRRLGRWWRGK